MKPSELAARVQGHLDGISAAVSEYLGDEARCVAVNLDPEVIHLHLAPPRMSGRISRRTAQESDGVTVALIDHGSKGVSGIDLITKERR